MLRGLIAPRATAFVCAGFLGSLSAPALAQEHDSAAAQALFDQARELIRQGHIAEACPKLQESNRLDPGIGTQFHLADCYEQSGRVASAWATFLDVVSQARATNQLDREKVARQRADKLEPRLPRLLVNVPEGSKTGGLEIRRNGTLVGSAQWGTAMPIDPGDVELSASAPGKQTLRQTLRLEEGKIQSYSLPLLANAPEAVAPTPVPVVAPPPPPTSAAAPPTSTPAPAPPRDSGSSSGHGNTTLVLGLAGVGVVGLGVGSVFAIIAKNKDSESKTHCASNNPNSCSEAGVEQRNQAIRSGNVGTVAFIAGGAFLAGAGIVWLLSGHSTEEHARARSGVWASADVSTNRGAVYLEGSF
jgi:hypothetical protein